MVVVGGGSKYYGLYKMIPPPNCRIQDVTSLALFVHLSGLFISFYFHAFNTKTLWLVKEAVVVVGGSKYYGHYKITPPPPNCRIQDVTWLALFVHLSGLFISFYFHAFNTKTLWLVKEEKGDGGGGGGGGGSKYYGHYKMTPPPPTAEYKMLPGLPCLYI